MNWSTRSCRRAPTALRIPTSTDRLVARAVIRVTKLMQAIRTISAPTAAIPASTLRSPDGRVIGLPVDPTKCRVFKGARENLKGEAAPPGAG